MVVYKTGNEVIDWDMLTEVYFQVDGVIGLGKKRDTSRIKKSFANSFKVVTARDNGKIIGAGRMISDGYCYGWIHDIGVLPSFQKLGVGKGIMDELMNVSEPLLFGLTSSFVAVEFYDKLGFKRHKTAMAKYPGKSSYLEE